MNLWRNVGFVICEVDVLQVGGGLGHEASGLWSLYATTAMFRFLDRFPSTMMVALPRHLFKHGIKYAQCLRWERKSPCKSSLRNRSQSSQTQFDV